MYNKKNIETIQVVYSADALRLIFIANALGIRDKYTAEHAQRVAIYAQRIARRLGLPEKDVENIAVGGMLHDIGKIGFSDPTFTNGQTNLSSDMVEEIRLHPLVGVSILKAVNFLDPILDCVLYHHERIDGTGYPCGLNVDQIPLGARIISVADSFDAITTDRPYQKGKTRNEAFAILDKISGKSLSSELVEALIDDIREKGMLKT